MKITVNLDIEEGVYTSGMTELDVLYICKCALTNEMLGYAADKIPAIDYPDIPVLLRSIRNRIYELRKNL